MIDFKLFLNYLVKHITICNNGMLFNTNFVENFNNEKHTNNYKSNES